MKLRMKLKNLNRILAFILIFTLSVSLAGCVDMISKDGKNNIGIIFNSEYLCKPIGDVYNLLGITESDVEYSEGYIGKVYLNETVEIDGMKFRKYLLYSTYKQYEDTIYGIGYESATNDVDKAKQCLKTISSQFNAQIGEAYTSSLDNIDNISANKMCMIDQWKPDSNKNVLYITLSGNFRDESNIVVSAEYHLYADLGNETAIEELDKIYKESLN